MRLHMRIWNTLREPRTVTALMVLIYLLVAISGVAVLSIGPNLTMNVIIGSASMIIGGATAIPSAWKGAWWLEGVAALLSVLGMSMVTIIQAVRSIQTMEWPHHDMIVMIVVILFMLTRILRIWPSLYRPGIIPASQVELAKARMQGAQQAERHAASYNR